MRSARPTTRCSAAATERHNLTEKPCGRGPRAHTDGLSFCRESRDASRRRASERASETNGFEGDARESTRPPRGRENARRGDWRKLTPWLSMVEFRARARKGRVGSTEKGLGERTLRRPRYLRRDASSWRVKRIGRERSVGSPLVYYSGGRLRAARDAMRRGDGERRSARWRPRSGRHEKKTERRNGRRLGVSAEMPERI